MKQTSVKSSEVSGEIVQRLMGYSLGEDSDREVLWASDTGKD